MDQLIITMAPAQRRRAALSSFGLMGVLLLLQLLTHRIHSWGYYVYPCWLLLVVPTLFGFRTTVSDRGIQIRRLFVPGPVRPWSAIASLTSELTERSETIKYTLTSGKRITLPVPVDHRSNRNPAFDGQRDQVLALWHRYAVTTPPPAGTGEPEQAGRGRQECTR